MISVVLSADGAIGTGKGRGKEEDYIIEGM